MRPEVQILLGVLGAAVALTFPLARRLEGEARRRLVGWLLLAVLQITAFGLSRPLGVWGRILATWAATFVGFKGLVLLEESPERLQGLVAARYAGWELGWLGMDLDAWLRPLGRRWTPPAWRTLAQGAGLVLAGGAICAAFALIPFPASWRLVQAWGVTGGLLIAIFFGATRLLAGSWQALGRDVPPLFSRPLASRSLADFWGRRWNLSVHTVLLETLWKPVRRKLGPAGATDAVFIASGLLHEYLVSYPARGGYGGPLLYFVLQSVGLRLERTRRVRALLRRSPAAGRAWTLAFVLGPAWLLFHPPIVRATVMPWLP